MNRITRLVAISCLLAAVGSAVPAASDWTRWRGPDQDGRTTGSGVFAAETFGLDVSWSRPLGIAYSGIAVRDGRAVTMFGDGETDWLVALDTATGKELWRYKIDATFPRIGGSDGGPLSMPVIDGDVVYGVGPRGRLFAVRATDGSESWTIRLADVVGARAPHFGFATSPLPIGDLVIVQAGGDEGRSIVGLDRKTGAVRWSSGNYPAGYQSPILATLAGQQQILTVNNTVVTGLVPESGEVLWSQAHGTSERAGGQTPVLLGDDRILVNGREGGVAYRVKRDEDGYEVEELWRTTALKGSFAVPVMHEGHLYGFDGNFLTCVDASDGTKVWKSRPPGGNGLIVVDDHLVIFAGKGMLVVAEASSEGYREKARVQVSEHGSNTFPSFAENAIFVRNIHDIARVTVREATAVSQTAPGTAPRSAFDRFVLQVEASDDKRLLVDDFMASQDRFPIVEDERLVHFVYRGDVEDIAVTGSMTEMEVEEALVRIEGTDLHYRSYPIEPGMRWEYRFNVDFENLQPDPLNPRRLPTSSGAVSELIMPGRETAEYVRPYTGGNPGRLESFELPSSILGTPRNIDVYLPAGYDAGTERYPLLVVSGGKDWLDEGSLPNSLNNLIGDRVAPVIVAFVETPRRVRRDEMGGDKTEPHLRMLAEELVPRLDESYRTIARSESRAIMGTVRGALIAAFAAVERPEVFGHAVAYSLYLAQPAGEKLLEAVERRGGEGKPRFRILWNHYEMRRAEWGFDLAADSERVLEALRAAGYDAEGGEAMDSEGWGSRREQAGTVLTELFPM